MNKFIKLAAVGALVAGCADAVEEEIVVDTPDTDGEEVILPPGTVALGDLQAAAFSADAETLTVVITLDGNNVEQVYQFDEITDDGYARFTQKLSETDRDFTGFGAASGDGGVQAVLVSDGGQFNRFFGGGFATQNDYTAPEGGIVNYSGGYIGLLNFSLEEASGGVEDSISATPRQSAEVTGDIFFKADFSDNAVNGAIFNREITGGDALPEIVLTVGIIDADGNFTGDVELTDLTGVGEYTGVFGGDGASSVAGVVRLEDGFLDFPGEEEEEEEDDDKGVEIEHGIFVLDADAGAD